MVKLYPDSLSWHPSSESTDGGHLQEWIDGGPCGASVGFVHL